MKIGIEKMKLAHKKRVAIKVCLSWYGEVGRAPCASTVVVSSTRCAVSPIACVIYYVTAFSCCRRCST